jgi:predicted O-methyltransferase YrrM
LFPFLSIPGNRGIVKIRRLIRQQLFRVFLLLDRMGVHLLPKHYYSPMPDYAWLQDNRDIWTKPSAIPGVQWDVTSQYKWLDETCRDYYREVKGLEFYRTLIDGEWGLGYGPIESQILHCAIRKWKPSRIVEIGSGVSTMCMVHAARMNQEEGTRMPEITCIEPYPSSALGQLKGEIRLIPELCQTVSPSVFAGLSSGDLLFVDSSHAVKVGSDVVRIYLEIIPSLKPGVLVHIHDIYLPYLYPRDALFKPFGWQETALLLALLINNDRLQVLSSLSALHYACRKELKQILLDYEAADEIRGLALSANPRGHFPSSIWLRTC